MMTRDREIGVLSSISTRPSWSWLAQRETYDECLVSALAALAPEKLAAPVTS